MDLVEDLLPTRSEGDRLLPLRPGDPGDPSGLREGRHRRQGLFGETKDRGELVRWFQEEP